MGEHKTGVPERTRKRKQKKIIVSCLMIVFIVIFIVGLFMMNNDKPDDNDVTEPVETVEPTEGYTEPPEMASTSVKIGKIGENGNVNIFDEWAEQTEFHVGDAMMDGNLKIVYVSSGEYATEEGSVEDGYKVVRFEFYAENMNQTEEEISFYNFNGYADGKSVAMHYAGENTLYATLSPTRRAIGYIYLEVPVDAETVELVYTAEGDALDSSEITFVYDGEQSSGYVLSDISASENAHSVGDVIEAGSFKISYLNCYEYISEDENLQPSDGYRFVQCEFSMERLTEHTKIDVSSWDFAVYADGMPCNVKIIGDNNLNAILHAGDIATGVVTFEVPIDARVIEAEFMYDYSWHERTIFDISRLYEISVEESSVTEVPTESVTVDSETESSDAE